MANEAKPENYSISIQRRLDLEKFLLFYSYSERVSSRCIPTVVSYLVDSYPNSADSVRTRATGQFLPVQNISSFKIPHSHLSDVVYDKFINSSE